MLLLHTFSHFTCQSTGTPEEVATFNNCLNYKVEIEPHHSAAMPYLQAF